MLLALHKDLGVKFFEIKTDRREKFQNFRSTE